MTAATNVPSFATEDEAFAWMYQNLEDEDERCIDNGRFAFVDDDAAMTEFDRRANDGCCGSCEYTIVVDGRLAVIGCNYGH